MQTLLLRCRYFHSSSFPPAMAKASKGSDVTQPSGEKLDFDNDNLRGESNNSLQESEKKNFLNSKQGYDQRI